jgi:hypothetical protein
LRFELALCFHSKVSTFRKVPDIQNAISSQAASLVHRIG